MQPGKVVYLCWYDFQREREYVLTGEVTENTLYGGTMWEDWVNVKFTVPGMSAPICHHFRPERLSEQPDNVPHDEAFLVCGKSRANYRQVKGNPWLEMTEFKQAHWDEAHNRLQVDALEEFYRLWAIAINWRIGYTKHGEPAKPAKKPSETITQGSPAITQPYCPITRPSQTDRKMRCYSCEHLDYDHLNDKHEAVTDGQHFCGLHGRTPVNPDGPQQDLNHKGGCGFNKRKEVVQLSLF